MMAATVQYVATSNLGTNLTASRLNTSNTNRDGTGTLATLLTGGTNGTRVDRIRIKALGNTTAGMIRIFLADNQGSPAIRLLHEQTIAATTPAGTAKTEEYELVRTDGQPLILVPSGWTLRASTHVGGVSPADTFDVVPMVSGDF